MWARGQTLWCVADVALALTSCPYDAGANVAQVPRHLQSWAARSSTVQDVTGANSPPSHSFLTIKVWVQWGRRFVFCSRSLSLSSPNYAAFLVYSVAASSPAPFLLLERY